MAADSDGSLTAVVICEGDLHDPEFKNKFRSFLGKLKSLIEQPKTKKLKVNKVNYKQISVRKKKLKLYFLFL